MVEHFRENRGLITRDAARALGCSDSAVARLVSAGEWIRVFRGVYRLAVIAPSWEQSLMAACLAGGPETVVSGRAAARLHGLDGSWDETVEVSSTKRLRLSGVVCHLSTFQEGDRTRRGGIPVTQIERTLVDLAGGASEEALEIALDSALRQRRTTLARVRWRANSSPRKGVKGIGILLALLDERSSSTDSPLETRLARIIRASSLPLPQHQFRVMDGAKVLGRFDFAYPDAKLIIEVDGYRWHSGRHAWQKDRIRDNALNRLGWTVLRFTAEDLRSPSQVVEQIGAVLHPRLDSGVR